MTNPEKASLAKAQTNEPVEFWHTNFRKGHPELINLVQRRVRLRYVCVCVCACVHVCVLFVCVSVWVHTIVCFHVCVCVCVCVCVPVKVQPLLKVVTGCNGPYSTVWTG